MAASLSTVDSDTTSSGQVDNELQALSAEIKKKLRFFPGFPHSGINFVDFFLLFRYPSLVQRLCTAIADHVLKENPVQIDAVVALEARGFLIGPQVSIALNIPFIPIRKKGKLPGEVINEMYEKEYGQDTIEIDKNAISPGWRVLLIDDLMATGESLIAATKLIERSGGEVGEAFVMVELTYLNPRRNLPNHIPIFSLISLDV